MSLASRTLGAYSTVKTATVTLSDTASPHSVDYQGITDNYETVHFRRPERGGPAQRGHRLPGLLECAERPGPAWPWSTRWVAWPTTRSPKASATTATPRWPTRPPASGRPTSGAVTPPAVAPPVRWSSGPASRRYQNFGRLSQLQPDDPGRGQPVRSPVGADADAAQATWPVRSWSALPGQPASPSRSPSGPWPRPVRPVSPAC